METPAHFKVNHEQFAILAIRGKIFLLDYGDTKIDPYAYELCDNEEAETCFKDSLLRTMSQLDESDAARKLIALANIIHKEENDKVSYHFPLCCIFI